MTSISLAKGARISLEKKGGGELKKIKMGLGWDPARGDSIDLDASCLMISEDKKLIDQVWFRQKKSKCKSIVHGGDNLTGDGDGDDEVIYVDLSKVSKSVKYLVFTVNSFRGQTFDEVANASCRIYDDNDKTIVNYDLSEKGEHTGMLMVSLYRHGYAWKVRALGEVMSGRVVADMFDAAVLVI